MPVCHDDIHHESLLNIETLPDQLLLWCWHTNMKLSIKINKNIFTPLTRARVNDVQLPFTQ